MLEAVLAGLFGLLIGSFLNVCIYRLPRDLSVVHPRSFCPYCEKTIAWYDNIPILSYFILKRRCRYCAAPISWRYPAVELGTGILFFLSVLWFGWTVEGFKKCVFATIVLDLIMTGLEERSLRDASTYRGGVAGQILRWFTPPHPGTTPIFLSPHLLPPVHTLVESPSTL